MELENIVINSIKEIHTRKKKADLDSIITNIKDLTPEIIEETLKSLCQKNVLCIVERQGPPRVVINNGNNDKEFYHNRFNDLVIENNDDNSEQNGKNQNFTCAKGSQNNNDLYVKNHTRLSNNVTQRRRPDPVINMYPERDRLPSKSDYPKVNQTKKIRIMSDSITKGIRVKEFNSCLQNGNSRFKIFPGASVENLDYYANPTLEQERPDIVVIHVGINNLLSDHLSEMSDEDIAKQILDIGKKCKRYGVKKVFISALVISRRVNPNRIENLKDTVRSLSVVSNNPEFLQN